MRVSVLVAALTGVVLATVSARPLGDQLEAGGNAELWTLDDLDWNADTGEWTVLVTGATGRTGALVYEALAKTEGVTVRALVRNVTKAQAKLSCGACGPDEGVYQASVSHLDELDEAFAGADAVVILTASYPIKTDDGFVYPEGGYPKDVDWLGTVNQLKKAQVYGIKSVTLVSSMGTTTPDSFLDKLGDGHALFYKLNAEASTMSAGMHYTVIKPCGLTDEASKFASQVGSCDVLKQGKPMHIISRAAVAQAAVHAAKREALNAPSVRFDVCSDSTQPGKTDNWDSLFEQAAEINVCL